jgi:thioredoxin-like negative regulator of GroEL
LGDGRDTDGPAPPAEAVADRIVALDAGHAAVLVGIDRLVAVREALERRGVGTVVPASPSPSEAARERALLDVAWRGEGADVGALIARLRELDHAEARYHAANLLLAHGHPAEALEELEAVMRMEFALPPFLPGLALARLGQLRDLALRRDDAIRAYRGVLALDWAPADARAAAREGLEAPFDLSGGGESGDDAGTDAGTERDEVREAP